MEKAKTSTSTASIASADRHPLVGRGLHYKDEDAAVRYRAQIIAVIPSNSPTGDLALIQYFE